MNCRHCGAPLPLTLVDLGSAPPSNAYLTEHTLKAPEKWFPLRVLVCVQCWLVQTEDFTQLNELFDANYAYFSSFSTSWLDHAERYVTDMVARYGLGTDSHVVELGANDGYLLQFVRDRKIPCTGIEPTALAAAAAREKGLAIVEEFFNERLARELAEHGKQADLIVANNVLSHVPDVNDFVTGVAVLLKTSGIATFEFPHVMRLIAGHQFDTIYHEHYSYFSLYSVDRIFAANGLGIFDVEEHPTHGGSLRVFAQSAATGATERTDRVNELLEREEAAGMTTPEYYAGLQAKADGVKDDFLHFLLDAKRKGQKVAAYGAAAKGNTLLNYAGVRRDLIPYVAERNPTKQGKFMPGSRIPIVGEDLILRTKPDFVVILPWNISAEVISQLQRIREWNGQFVTALPNLQIQ
jgi:2-polyprenyl-3-methyl-5-hydroxy-6-metoxy-1,4-benzoquinol methylase